MLLKIMRIYLIQCFKLFSGKSGSGKTHLVMKELLTPGFLDYKEIYVLYPNINTKEY